GLDRHPIVRPSETPGAGVDGTLFFITQPELDAADVYEAEDYRRVEVTLTSGRTAWVYIAA
ncbi:MAG: gamma-glutamylcyclotransferase, partial [Brevundimonas sp.]